MWGGKTFVMHTMRRVPDGSGASWVWRRRGQELRPEPVRGVGAGRASLTCGSCS